ncbi:MAG: hypothetical protein B5M56_05590 [Desulfococcus sp. 4484_241]|nr:MAG: hypothetical protein B5M56_05590 [Desulfococcus sp. 4484_241]
MNKRKKRPNYTNEFKGNAVKLVVKLIAEAGLMDEKRLVDLRIERPSRELHKMLAPEHNYAHVKNRQTPSSALVGQDGVQ